MKPTTCLLALLLPFLSMCQPITIKGKVINEDGEPIPAATVTHNRTKQSVITNSKGEFSIDHAPLTTHDSRPNQFDSIMISAIGYETRSFGLSDLPSPLSGEGPGVRLFTLQRKSVTLQSVTLSTGYQTIPKERATGSFTAISNSLLNEQPGSNILNRLQHVTNGLSVMSDRTPGAPGGLLIRGLSSLNLHIAKPLIILDNFPYEGDISNINPNDVENITILKDAAAASLWGARAGNGVIVITTKKGRFNQKVKVDFNANITVAQKPNLMSLPEIAATDFVDLELFLFSRGHRFADTAHFNRPPFSPLYEMLFKRRAGLVSAADSAALVDALRGYDLRREFSRHFYQPSVNRQYALGVRGGASNIAWSLSAGWDQNNSDLDDSYNRGTISFSNTYKPVKNLEIISSLLFTKSRAQAGRPAWATINMVNGNLPPYTRFADENGQPLPVYTTYRQTFLDTAGAGRLLDWKFYPLTDYKHNQRVTSLQDISALLGINYRFSSSFQVELKYRYQLQEAVTAFLQEENSFYTRNLVNNYAQINRTTGIVTYRVPRGAILDRSETTLTAQDFRAQASFTRSWKNNDITAVAGTQVSEKINESFSYRTYGFNKDILAFTNVDFANVYPTFVNGFTAFIPNIAAINKTNNRFLSFYGNAAWSFKNRYTLSLSSRRDASNLFGLNTNDKWKPLFSAGFKWDLSAEPFYQFDALPLLGLRCTWGTQGNVDPTRVAVTTIDYTGTNPFTQTPIAQVANFYNPDLKWEQVRMFNLGIDFKTKNHRVSGSIEWYRKNSTDMYGGVQVDVTVGLQRTLVVKNVGRMEGHGFDIELNTVNTKGPLQWTSHIILNTYADKITKYQQPPPVGTSISSVVGGGNLGIEGYSTFSYFAYRWAGLDPLTGDPQGYINGSLSKNYASLTTTGTQFSDLVYIGRLLPLCYGSVGNTLHWKNITLTARLSYKFGYYFKRPSVRYSSLVSNNSGHADFSKRWKQPGDETFTNVPSFVYPALAARDNFYASSEILAERADHMRLQYINAGYTLSGKRLKKLPVENMKLSFIIANWGIIWKANKQGLDPDYPAWPPPRAFTIGFTANLR